ncbi:ABC transporter substrate-binding protein [Parenemella sanctibonifatiensis]|uniref:ABC transporter substrate-binding protein n=1 Tax=Parenemella sanctibonifatiensis TaxID=2016505 RepID=UPI001186B402|nr:ABC transporter substrate-binding protein [Parenemella sanctibonifatiensis]
MKRTTSWLAAVVAMVLVLSACGGQAEPAGTDPVDGGTVTVAIESDPAGQFNPHESGTDISAETLRAVFDSLVYLTPEGELKPWLATSWEVSEDQLSYTFTLREGVTFHDGEPFDAEAVKANFDHVRDPDTASKLASNLLGGKAYESTEVIDPQTVRINLNQPYAPLLTNLSSTYLGFISPKVLTTASDQLVAGGPGVTVGTGPYVLEQIVAGQEVSFTKNAAYAWGPEGESQGPSHPDRLVLRVLPEASVRAGALASGDVDIAGHLSPEDALSFAEDDQINLTRSESPGLPWTLFLNNRNGIFTDLQVRQAFQKGINISAAIEAVYAGTYQRAWSFLGANTPEYSDEFEESWPYDPEAANQLLDEAGWTERDAEGYRVKDGQRLSASWSLTQDRDRRGNLAEAFQADLREIGFELKLVPTDTGVFLQQLQSGEGYDIAAWSYVRTDGDVLRLHFHSELAPIQNAGWVNDPQLDEWVIAATRTTDRAERTELYRKVQERALEQAYSIPILPSHNIIGSRISVGGVETDIAGWPQLRTVWTTAGQ